MRTIIQRYLASHYLLPLIISIPFFIIFLLTFQLFRFMDLLIDKDVSIYDIFTLIGHICVSFLPLAVPIGILFSSIYSLNKLSGDSEIIAMRALGVSKLRLYLPFFILSFTLGLFVFILDFSYIPKSKLEFRKIVTVLGAKGVLTSIRKKQFFTQIPHLTLYAEDVSDNGTHLWDVLIHMSDKNGIEEKIIMAKEGQILGQGKTQEMTSGPSSLRMLLKDGNIMKNYFKKDETEKILFKEYNFPLDQNNKIAPLDTGPHLQSISQLYYTIKMGDTLAGFSKDGFIRTQLEFTNRFNTPLLCLIFSLLGLSLGIKRGRGRGGNSLSICFAALVGYYSLFFTGISLARKEHITVLVAMLIPLIFITIITLYLYRRLEWNS